MTANEENVGDGDDQRAGRPRFAPQLGVELIIGLALVALLVIVGWASSNAIRFVYGGY